jgi:signal peptidase
MKGLWKIVKVIFWVCLIAFMLNCFIQKVQGEHHPKTFGYGFGVVLTGSMEPNLPTHSFTVIKEQDTYEVGDIITYNHYTGRSVTHRIIEINGDEIKTQGDANNTADPVLSREDIIGKVICYFDVMYILVPVGCFAIGSLIYCLIPSKKKDE